MTGSAGGSATTTAATIRSPGPPRRWHDRRIIAARQYEPGLIDTDVSLVNWPQIDYWGAPVLGVSESRRIEAEFRILEQHVGVQACEATGLDAGSELFADSVGIGHHRIDLHPSTAGRTYIDVESYPFQVRRPVSTTVSNPPRCATTRVGWPISNGC